MPGYKVLISDPLPAVAVEILARTGEIEAIERQDEIEVVLPECDAWIVRSGTQVTADLLAHAAKLRCVCRAGAGVDNVDVEAATARNVLVMNTPGANSLAAAEHTIALLFALARNVGFAHHAMVGGGWDRKKYVGVQVEGKTLGVLGLGRVGRLVGEKGLCLGMRVIAVDPYLPDDLKAGLSFPVTSMEELLGEADFIALHTPLSEETRGMIGSGALEQCKPGVRIVNCSRGGVVDEEALLVALDSGRVAGAALDVYSEEPPPADSPLRRHPAILLTPHLGASTHEAQLRVATQSAEQVRDFLIEGRVQAAVNSVNGVC